MWWSVVSTPSLSHGDDSGLKESRWGYGLLLENVSKFVQVVKISFCAPSSLFYRPLKINPCKFIQTVLEFTWFYFTNVHITKQTKEILECQNCTSFWRHFSRWENRTKSEWSLILKLTPHFCLIPWYKIQQNCACVVGGTNSSISNIQKLSNIHHCV